MLASEIKKVIELQAAEFSQTSPIHREKSSILSCTPGYATIVSGVRRCGKSTLLRQWCSSMGNDSLMLNFDDFRMMSFTPDDFRVLDTVLEDCHPHTVIFDEIQTIPGWELYIRQKLDAHYDCMVTGSNASMLSRELGTKLTGRHLNLELFPFSYKEFLTYSARKPDSESLDCFLKDGGFPGYLQTHSSDVLKTLLEDILYRDIAVRYGIQNVDNLRSLALYLISVAANLVNPSKLVQTFNVRSSTTLLEYFNYLEQSYLIQRVPKIAFSRRAQQLAPKKVYVIDNALITVHRLINRPDNGFLLENAVFNHFRNHGYEISYYSDTYGECDFILKDHAGNFSAYQVCWEISDSSKEREFRGLTRCLKAFGLNEGSVITFNQKDFAVQDGMAIHVIPAHEFFLAHSMPEGTH